MKKRNVIIISAILGIVFSLAIFGVMMVAGVFDAKLERLVFVSGSSEQFYNGAELTSDEWELVDGELKSGHYIEAKIIGKQTNAGESRNIMSVTIFNEKGKDVTDHYEIEYEYGTLRVNPEQIRIQASNATKEYDGELITCDSYTLVSGSIASGHKLQVVTAGERDEVGVIANTALATVIDSDGNDVSSNYAFFYVDGTLEVTPNEITIQSGGGKKVYDGEALTCPDYEIVLGELVEGHELEIVVTGEQINAGVGQNTFGVEIKDKDGNPVTHNYKINAIYGPLEVEKRPITVRSGSASKVYDGEPLYCEDYEVVSQTNILEGHNIYVKNNGEQTEIGKSENLIAEIIITDGEGEVVTFNYDTTIHQYGVLEVREEEQGEEPEPTTPELPEEDPSQDPTTPPSPGLSLDGNIIGPEDGEAGENVVLRIYSSESGGVYLRAWSYGNYNGKGWDHSIAPYGELIDGRYSANYLTGIALESSGNTSYGMKIESLAGNYVLPTYMDAEKYNYAIQTSDTIYGGVVEGIYSVYYYNVNFTEEMKNITLPNAYSEYEEDYRKYVYDNYLDVPAGTKAYLDILIASNGFSKSNENIISEVASFIQSSATYNMEYDRNLDKESDKVVAFLSKYKEGICQHYASSATLLFRSLGIPARYTAGFSATTVAGEWNDVQAKQGHAWVEVYLDGIGWVAIEVTGGGGGNNGEPVPSPDVPNPDEPNPDEPNPDEPNPDEPTPGPNPDEPNPDDPNNETLIQIVVESVSVDHKYDGAPFSVDEKGAIKIDSYALSYLMENGYTYDYTLSATLDCSGLIPIEISSFEIFDSNGENATSRFSIEKKLGQLHVYESELYITSMSYSKVYDTAPLFSDPNGYTYSILKEGYDPTLLESTHEVVVKFSASVTNAQTVANVFTAKVMNGEEDESVRYKITYIFGTLSVTRRKIVVTADSYMQKYTGETITCQTWQITDGEICEGHKEIVTIVGEQTVRGYSDNKITDVEIYDSNGNKVTSNYTIVFVHGRLTVY